MKKTKMKEQMETSREIFRLSCFFGLYGILLPPPSVDSLDEGLEFLLQLRTDREGALEILFGFGVLALPHQSQSAVPVSDSVARSEFDGAIEVIDRAIQFIPVTHYYPAAVVARGEARIKIERLVEILQRPVLVPFLAPRETSIVVYL